MAWALWGGGGGACQLTVSGPSTQARWIQAEFPPLLLSAGVVGQPGSGGCWSCLWRRPGLGRVQSGLRRSLEEEPG